MSTDVYGGVRPLEEDIFVWVRLGFKEFLEFGSCEGNFIHVSCARLRFTRKGVEVPNREDSHTWWTKISCGIRFDTTTPMLLTGLYATVSLRSTRLRNT